MSAAAARASISPATGSRAARRRGVEFHLIGPLRDDLPAEVEAVWHPIRPGTDVALMLGLAHTLVAEGLHDRDFLDRYCVGWEIFAAYLLGRSDGQPKDAAWAAAICGMPADEIIALARRAAGRRTLVTCSHVAAARRAWRAAGLDGGRAGGDARPDRVAGRRLCLCAGRRPRTPASRRSRCRCRHCRSGRNSIADFIPVARIADMLLHPGEAFDYNGRRLTYPDIRLVYWAGGNPFHHHQDLGPAARRLCPPGHGRSCTNSVWTATARHADIVLPATITLEREDIGAAAGDPLLVAMHRAVPPYREARDDHAIFAGLAERLGFAEPFHRGPLGAAMARTSLRADPPRAGRARRQRARFRRVLGAGRAGPADRCRGTAASSAPSAATPTARRCRRRAARSRSPRRRSPASAMPTAPATRPGCRRSRR